MVASEYVENIQNPKVKTSENKRKNEKIGKPTNEEIEIKELFSYLPKISSKEYVGKDICRICTKTVGENHRAVSCDNCDRWLHIKCTDMEVRTYKMVREKRRFNWVCHKSRESENL